MASILSRIARLRGLAREQSRAVPHDDSGVKSPEPDLDLAPGERSKVARVPDNDAELLRYLPAT
jgi:hypothetical protein